MKIHPASPQSPQKSLGRERGRRPRRPSEYFKSCQARVMKDAAQQARLETSGQQDSHMPPVGESRPAEKAPCSLALSVLISSAPASMGRWQYEKAEIRGIAPDLAERGGEVERTEKDGSRIALWRGLV